LSGDESLEQAYREHAVRLVALLTRELRSLDVAGMRCKTRWSPRSSSGGRDDEAARQAALSDAASPQQ
jgi:hypothetical protein